MISNEKNETVPLSGKRIAGQPEEGAVSFLPR